MMKTSSARFQRLADKLARDFAPPIEQCNECGHPKLQGYVCKPCYERAHAIIVARSEVIQEMKALYPDWMPPTEAEYIEKARKQYKAGPRKSAPAPMPKRDPVGRAKLRALLHG